MAVNGSLQRGTRLLRTRLLRTRLRAWFGPRRRGERTPEGVARADVERLLARPVGDLRLYAHALKHRSVFRGHLTTGTESNERLEFLGDAVLGAVVAEKLYTAFPDRDEGFLTRLRAQLVNGQALADYALALGLGPLILMSDNMAASQGRTNTTILADAFEAVVGAVYLDLGFAAARDFVARLLDQLVDLDALAEQRSNYKSLLLEYVQARGWPQPTYTVAAEQGPSHDRLFTIDVIVDGAARGRGLARSKKQAEQAAAREALDALRHDLEPPPKPRAAERAS